MSGLRHAEEKPCRQPDEPCNHGKNTDHSLHTAVLANDLVRVKSLLEEHDKKQKTKKKGAPVNETDTELDDETVVAPTAKKKRQFKRSTAERKAALAAAPCCGPNTSVDIHARVCSTIDEKSELHPYICKQSISIAVYRGFTEMVRLLLDHGADANSKVNEACSPVLHTACSNGDTEIVKLLLQHGADPNFRNCRRNPPLHIAVHFQHADVVAALVEHGGVDPSAKDHWGDSPLHDLQDVRTGAVLVRLGSDLNVLSDQDGTTPLVRAAKEHGPSSPITQFLLRAGTKTSSGQQTAFLGSIIHHFENMTNSATGCVDSYHTMAEHEAPLYTQEDFYGEPTFFEFANRSYNAFEMPAELMAFMLARTTKDSLAFGITI